MHTVLRLLQAQRVPAVFDLEGTLVDLEMFHFVSWERALDDEGIAVTVKEIASLPGVIGGGDPFIAETLALKYGLSAEVILAQKRKHFMHMIEEQPILPRPGAVEFLTRLQNSGVRVALASLTSRSRGEEILHRSGLTHFFSEAHVLFRENVTNPKPHPEVYEQTAQRLGVSPAEQIVFEDSPVGVRAAKMAGSRVVAIPAPFFHEEPRHLLALREAGADAIYFHWTDLPLFSFLPISAQSGV